MPDNSVQAPKLLWLIIMSSSKANRLLCLNDRCDLARAIEKWGGPSALAEDLAYGVTQRGARQSATALSLIRRLYLAASTMILMSSRHQQLTYQPLLQPAPGPLLQQ
jgi:hypothetical protein